MSETLPNPEPNKQLHDYCVRLEHGGHDEIAMRKAVREHFDQSLEELGVIFESYEKARLQHIADLVMIEPNRDDYSLKKKLAKNLYLSDERAGYWVRRFRKLDQPV